MEDVVWDRVKDFYKSRFNIDSTLVELASDVSVLTLCCSGACNEKIAGLLTLDLKIVPEILKTYFAFSGWEKDLLINPKKLFMDNLDTPIKFYKDAKKLSDMDDKSLDIAFRCCKILRAVEEELIENWI